MSCCNRHCRTSLRVRSAPGLGAAPGMSSCVRGSSEFELTGRSCSTRPSMVEMKLMPSLADDTAAGHDPAGGHNTMRSSFASDVHASCAMPRRDNGWLNLEAGEMRVHARTQRAGRPRCARASEPRSTRREGAENILCGIPANRNSVFLSEQLMKAPEVERKADRAGNLHDAVGGSP